MKGNTRLQGKINAFLTRKTRQYPELDGYVDDVERL